MLGRGVLIEKPEGKRPLGRHRCKWGDNIVTCKGYATRIYVDSLDLTRKFI
jgi:hypothetical protein